MSRRSCSASRFEPRPDVPVWHDEVDVYDVLQDGEPLGRIFLDMHPRADKFSHAAMFSLQRARAAGGCRSACCCATSRGPASCCRPAR